MNDQRPRFLPSFLDLVRKEAEHSGWLAVLPYVLVIVVAVSAAVAFFVPINFWANPHWDISTAVYSGLLTFNGLILALGWSAFGRMYDVLLRDDFGRYLAQRNLLTAYMVHITFMHMCQVLSVVAAGLGLVTVLLDDFPMWLDRTVFALAMAATIYSLKQGISAVVAMNDLVWQATFFELHKPEAANLRKIKSSGAQ